VVSAAASAPKAAPRQRGARAIMKQKHPKRINLANMKPIKACVGDAVDALTHNVSMCVK
jgi:hypothetical protein